MSTGDSVEIVTQPEQLSEEQAFEQVQNRTVDRLKSAITAVEPIRAVRRYKPFYSYDVTLTKRMFRGDDIVTEGCIVVDAMANIARPFTSERIDETHMTVSPNQILSPQISEEEALQTANSRRMQVEHRERGSVEMNEDPQTVYKPVWIVELSNDELRVVDAVDGTVFSDLLLG